MNFVKLDQQKKILREADVLSALTTKADLVNGTVPLSQLPDTSQVAWYDTAQSFPSTGQQGIIYVDKQGATLYRWTGTTYIAIVLTLGQSSQNAFAGNRGVQLEQSVSSKITAPATGTTGQYLRKTSQGVQWATPAGVASDYELLNNLPKIQSVQLKGDKSAADLGLALSTDIPTTLAQLSSDTTHMTVTQDQITTWNSKLPSPATGQTGQYLRKTASGTQWYTISIGGATDYNDISNHPQIEGVQLKGNKTASAFGLALASAIPTALSALTDDETHRLVTDTQKTTWNAKITSPDTGTTGQYLQKTDSGTQWATVDVLPTTGTTGQYLQKTADATQWTTVTLASLSDDATHRLVTDTQKTTWNAKITSPDTGTTGQYLQKTDSGTQWSTVEILPTTGTAGQFLAKTSTGSEWLTISISGNTITVGSTTATIKDAAADISIADAGSYFIGTTVEAALQQLGQTLDGLETTLAGI